MIKKYIHSWEKVLNGLSRIVSQIFFCFSFQTSPDHPRGRDTSSRFQRSVPFAHRTEGGLSVSGFSLKNSKHILFLSFYSAGTMVPLTRPRASCSVVSSLQPKIIIKLRLKFKPSGESFRSRAGNWNYLQKHARGQLKIIYTHTLYSLYVFS